MDEDILDDILTVSGLSGTKQTKPASPEKNISPLLDAMRGGTRAQESSGGRNLVNKRTGALGDFQVLPENVRPWTRKHLGREMSEREFFSDPQAQRRVFDGEMGEYLRAAKATGADDETAIRMGAAGWYGGKGAMHRYNDFKRFRPDEPSFGEYTSSVLGKTNNFFNQKPLSNDELIDGILDKSGLNPQATATFPIDTQAPQNNNQDAFDDSVVINHILNKSGLSFDTPLPENIQQDETSAPPDALANLKSQQSQLEKDLQTAPPARRAQIRRALGKLKVSIAATEKETAQWKVIAPEIPSPATDNEVIDHILNKSGLRSPQFNSSQEDADVEAVLNRNVQVGLTDFNSNSAVQFPPPMEKASETINIVPPVPETSETRQAQLESTKRVDSPRVAILYTKGVEVPSMSLDESKILTDVSLPETGETIRINNEKALSLGLDSPEKVQEFIKQNGYASLIAKAENVGTNTAGGVAVVARDKNGNELSASQVTNLGSAQKQMQFNHRELGNNINQSLDTGNAVVNDRMAKNGTLPPTLEHIKAAGGVVSLEDAPEVRAYRQEVERYNSANQQITPTVSQPQTQPQIKSEKVTVDFAQKSASETEQQFAKRRVAEEIARRYQIPLGDVDRVLDEAKGDASSTIRANLEGRKDRLYDFTVDAGIIEKAKARREALRRAVLDKYSHDGEFSADDKAYFANEGVNENALNEIVTADTAEALNARKNAKNSKELYQASLQRWLNDPDNRSKAQIFASLDAGYISTDQANELVTAQDEVEERYRNEEGNRTTIAYDDVNGRKFSVSERALRQNEIDTNVAERLAEMRKEYGSAKNFLNEERKDAAESSEYWRTAHPFGRSSEAIKTGARYIAKLPATIIDAVGVASDLNPITMAAEYVTGKDAKPALKPIFDVADSWRKAVDNDPVLKRNNIYKKDFIVNEVSEGVAQFLTQMVAAPLTGGYSLALPIAEAATSQYKEADKAGAGKGTDFWRQPSARSRECRTRCSTLNTCDSYRRSKRAASSAN